MLLAAKNNNFGRITEPMEEVVDLSTLLDPIPGDNPAGIDLREQRSPEYVDAKEARNNARAAERAAMLDPDNADNPDRSWAQILSLAPDILTRQAKDLEIAVWYLEALVRLENFAGLCGGLSLLNGLVEHFWENLYPAPDEDGLETKVAPLTGINGEGGADGTLIAPMRKIEITAPGTGSGEFDSFSYWHFHQAQEASKIGDSVKRSERHQKLGYSLDSIHKAVAASPNTFYLDIVTALETSLEQYKLLNDTLYDHFKAANCEADVPPSSSIINILEELLRAIRFLAKDKLLVAEAAQDTPEQDMAGNSDAVSPASPAANSSSGPLASRAAALNQLREVAQYFRLTEPHTPVADGIDRIIRWANMPVGLLMQELMPDANSRAVYTLLTGVEIGNPGEASKIEPVDVAEIASVSDAATQSGQSASEDDINSGW